MMLFFVVFTSQLAGGSPQKSPGGSGMNQLLGLMKNPRKKTLKKDLMFSCNIYCNRKLFDRQFMIILTIFKRSQGAGSFEVEFQGHSLQMFAWVFSRTRNCGDLQYYFLGKMYQNPKIPLEILDL